MPQFLEHGLMDSSPAGALAVPPGADRERDLARRRVERKSKLRADLVAYVVINAFLVGIWAVSGLGYFWPGWVLAGWGVLLLLDAWDAYVRRPVTEADVERELNRR
jgi:hypothetical protein